MNCLCNKKGTLTDANAFYDFEPGINSRATHVPYQTSTFLNPRTLPRSDSGLPRDAQNGTGQETFLIDILLKKGDHPQSSTIRRI